MQFRIRNLLFLTFVCALVGGLVSLSPPVGCLAALPISIATARTLRRGSIEIDGRMQSRRLWVSFFQSLWLLAALIVVSLLWAITSLGSVTFLLTRWLLWMFQILFTQGHRAMQWTGADRAAASLYRHFKRAVTWLVAGTAVVTDWSVDRLNRTNRSLYTHWSN